MPFFTIPLHPDCQFLFTFTWTDPETRQSSQLTWTVLPQGFRDSPHFFFFWPGSGLGSVYVPFGPSVLLQYVDDLLLCSPSQALSQTHTTILLNFLSSKGYQTSQQKAQLTQTSVTYLGLKITLTTKALTTDRLSLL